jgi:hypothetical protein
VVERNGQGGHKPKRMPKQAASLKQQAPSFGIQRSVSSASSSDQAVQRSCGHGRGKGNSRSRDQEIEGTRGSERAKREAASQEPKAITDCTRERPHRRQ